jgi:predicted RNase H-like nuclease (RuvC/YqgF family)
MAESPEPYPSSVEFWESRARQWKRMVDQRDDRIAELARELTSVRAEIVQQRLISAAELGRAEQEIERLRSELRGVGDAVLEVFGGLTADPPPKDASGEGE